MLVISFQFAIAAARQLFAVQQLKQKPKWAKKTEKYILKKVNGKYANAQQFVKSPYWKYLHELLQLDLKEGWLYKDDKEGWKEGWIEEKEVDGKTVEEYVTADDNDKAKSEIIKFLKKARAEKLVPPGNLTTWTDPLQNIEKLHMFGILADVIHTTAAMKQGTELRVFKISDVLVKIPTSDEPSNFGKMKNIQKAKAQAQEEAVQAQEEAVQAQEEAVQAQEEADQSKSPRKRDRRGNKKENKKEVQKDKQKEVQKEVHKDEQKDEETDKEDILEDESFELDTEYEFKSEKIQYNLRHMKILGLSNYCDEQIVFEGEQYDRLQKELRVFQETLVDNDREQAEKLKNEFRPELRIDRTRFAQVDTITFGEAGSVGTGSKGSLSTNPYQIQPKLPQIMETETGNVMKITGRPGIGKSFGSFVHFLTEGDQDIWIHTTLSGYMTVVVKFDQTLFVVHNYLTTDGPLILENLLCGLKRQGLSFVFFDGCMVELYKRVNDKQRKAVQIHSLDNSSESANILNEIKILKELTCYNWRYVDLLRALYHPLIVKQFVWNCLRPTKPASEDDQMKALDGTPLTNSVETFVTLELFKVKQIHAYRGENNPRRYARYKKDLETIDKELRDLAELSKLGQLTDEKMNRMFEIAMDFFTTYRDGRLLIKLVNRRLYVAGASPRWFFSNTEQEIERAINEGIKKCRNHPTKTADTLFAWFQDDRKAIISEFAARKLEGILQEKIFEFFRRNAAVYLSIGLGKDAGNNFEWFFYAYTKYKYQDKIVFQRWSDKKSPPLPFAATNVCIRYSTTAHIEEALLGDRDIFKTTTAWLWPNNPTNAGFDCMFVNMDLPDGPRVILVQVTVSDKHDAKFNTLTKEIDVIEQIYKRGKKAENTNTNPAEAAAEDDESIENKRLKTDITPNAEKDDDNVSNHTRGAIARAAAAQENEQDAGNAVIFFVMLGPKNTYDKLSGNRRIKIGTSWVPSKLKDRAFMGRPETTFTESNVKKFTQSIYMDLTCDPVELNVETIFRPIRATAEVKETVDAAKKIDVETQDLLPAAIRG